MGPWHASGSLRRFLCAYLFPHPQSTRLSPSFLLTAFHGFWMKERESEIARAGCLPFNPPFWLNKCQSARHSSCALDHRFSLSGSWGAIMFPVPNPLKRIGMPLWEHTGLHGEGTLCSQMPLLHWLVSEKKRCAALIIDGKTNKAQKHTLAMWVHDLEGLFLVWLEWRQLQHFFHTSFGRGSEIDKHFKVTCRKIGDSMS